MDSTLPARRLSRFIQFLAAVNFLERHNREFLHSGEGTSTFMNPVSFEQVEILSEMLGSAEPFLQPGMALPGEFFESKPMNVILPQFVEVKVATTAPPIHAQQDSAWKEATLENGLEITVAVHRSR